MNKHISQTLRTTVAVVLAVCASVSLQAQTGVEYFLDSDPGIGKGTRIAVTPDEDGNVGLAISTKDLSPGTHLLGFRAYHVDANLVTHYAPTITQNVEVSSMNIFGVEYFWDTDPGFGQGIPVPITPDKEVILDNIEIPTEGLSQGRHVLGIRSYGEQGWSPTLVQEVYVPSSAPDGEDVSRIEYFWDTDPGYGKGLSLPITPGQEVNLENVEIPTTGIAYGDHVLFIRAYGNSGWGPTLHYPVHVEPADADMIVSNAEYFWNEDPGFGQATPISITPGATVNITDFNVPSETVHGDAVLYIRYRGPMGWSPTMAYPVMVDASGNYTLNANAETSMEQRNYQSLVDAFDDFADRGISDNITITVTTTETDYTLDATSDARLAQLAQIAQRLEDISANNDHKTIAFTATEGSGNSITVTTTDEGLPTVVSLFAQTSQENVTLTINGTAYDFTPAAQRFEEGCGSTTAVALSAISTAVKATWVAQPHESTTISGFTVEGKGDLPAMTLTNSGAEMDSLAYRVTLSTTKGVELYSYTYYIYVHARMDSQSFTMLSPASGASMDPGKTALQWNKFNDAQSYRLVVAEAADGGEPAEIVNVETDQTSYDVSVKSGYRYTWTVTAIGHCDELTSSTMTFKGRLLPDLIVESINLPEGCPPGSMADVTATIRNQGQGATTEGEWTDRLYYVINSTDFKDAVETVDVTHTGNVAAGDSYEVTFQMQVPFTATTGTLRVFVTANVDKAAMETDTGNNRLLSTTSATLTPVYMDVADLAALRQFYQDFGGDQWNGTKWNVGSELIANSYWSGVTFDSDGHVTAIDLYRRNLSGSMTTATPLSLPRLTTLKLGYNSISGDPSKFITGEGVPMLKELDMSENLINDLSAPLPASITNINFSWQYPSGYHSAIFDFSVSNNINIDFPTIMGYDHQMQTLGNHPTVNVHMMPYPYTRIGQLRWSSTEKCYVFEGEDWRNQVCNQDDEVVLRPSGGLVVNSGYCGHIHLTLGDANMTGWVDVNDVQRTLNYVINQNNSSSFNLWCANTWDADDIINIQDIVCTVNIVLDNQGGTSMAAPRRRAGEAGAANRFYTSGRYVLLSATDEIAAFDLELEGVTPSQVKLLLNRNDWQMQTRETDHGVRLVVFSPTGQTLMAGDTQLLRISGNTEITAAQATSPTAEHVAVNMGDTTGIRDVQSDDAEAPVYDMQGRRRTENQLSKGIYIQNGKKVKR